MTHLDEDLNLTSQQTLVACPQGTQVAESRSRGKGDTNIKQYMSSASYL